MRTNLTIVVLLFFITGIAWVSNSAIDSFSLNMLDTLSETSDSIMAEDWKEARQQTESIKQSLSESRSWITMLINQRMLNELEIVTERLRVSAELEDQLAAMAELVSLKSYLEEFHSDTLITLTNLL